VTRGRRLWIAAGLLAAVALGLLGASIYEWQMPRVRGTLVAILSERLGSDVSLDDLQVHPGRTMQITGRTLVLRHRHYHDVPPLARIERFTIAVPWSAIFHTPIHISAVTLEGLRIYVPPKTRRQAQGRAPFGLASPSPVVVDHIRAAGAVLEIGTDAPGRDPRRFELHQLELTDAAFNRAIKYRTRLTNPVPRGTIVAHGTFGPWDADDPSLTPLTGDYTFRDADLGTIKGISGTLASEGSFGGRLRQIDVRGTTKTPDFSLDIGGSPVPLTTDFAAIVDGTNGDTLLTSVHAVLGRSTIAAKGGIVHVGGDRGRTLQLDASITGGRLDDVLHLAMDDEPPAMSGGLNLTTRIELPPGDAAVPVRLRLNGEFRVASARFSSDKVQAKIDELSRRGRGRPEDARVQNVASNLTGRFVLGDGRLRLSPVSFAVRGATIRLSGTYSLPRRTLDFTGTARMEARASEMITGWKRIPMKILDPLLARNGAGTVLPIRVTGPVEHPDFKVEIGKIF
jgi:hypothetical protein